MNFESEPRMDGQWNADMPGLGANEVITEAFVLLAMALATLALGTALYLQFSLSFVAAVVCALAVYLGLLATHALVHRNSAVGALKAELADLERHFAHATGMGGFSATGTDGKSRDGDGDTLASPVGTEALSGDDSGAADFNPEPPVSKSEREGKIVAKAEPIAPSPPLGNIAPPPLVPVTAPVAKRAAEASPEAAFNAQDPAWYSNRWDRIAPPPVDLADNVGRYGAGEPVGPVAMSPPLEPDERGTQKTATAIDNPVIATSRPPRETDVEMIQVLIKKLADEVNSANGTPMETTPAPDQMPVHARAHQGDQERGLETSGSASVAPTSAQMASGPVTIASQIIASQIQPSTVDGSADAQVSGEELEPATPEPKVEEPTGQEAADLGNEAEDHLGQDPSEKAIESSVDALRAAADVMRDHDEPASADAGVFAIISEALSTGRVDVLLDPILGLENRRARHFEISLRLRDLDNSVIDTTEHGQNLSFSGLNTLIDRATLSRTATVSVQLDSRGRQGAVFSKFAAQSFATEEFVDDIHAALKEHAALPGQLVMTLSQAHVRVMGAREWETLADLKGLGFRFAISSVTDLDMDFEDLSEKDFAFIKLDAEVFLNGMPAGETLVAPGDICKHFAGAGLTVIVERIDDDEVLGKVYGYGVQFGQGQLFGGPRTVKAQALKSSSGTAAA